MPALVHAKFIVYSFATWLLFYLIGLPDYYQSWPFWSKVVLCVVVTLICRQPGPCALLCPDPGEAVLLPDTGLILEPQFNSGARL